MAFDYIITKHGIEPLTIKESKFWCALRNGEILTYKDAIENVYGIKLNKEIYIEYYINKLSVIQSRLNKKIEGVIVRRKCQYFRYIDEKELQKKVEEQKIWKYRQRLEKKNW